MKKHQLTRNEMTKLSRGQSKLAEELAADMYGYKTFLSERFDAARESGAALEVKSTVTRYESGARGRFRLFKPQHETLRNYDQRESGRYAFVLFDVSTRPPVALMKLKRPAAIGNMISGLGGFNKSGHPSGKQIKIPYSRLFNR